MRTINATLQAALDSGGYQAYIKARVQRSSPAYDFTFDVLNYRLDKLSLSIKAYGLVPISTPSVPVTIQLIRGVTIAGVNYTVSTSPFISIKGSVQTLSGESYFSEVNAHMINPLRMSFLADGTYEDAISDFCAALGKTYTLKDPSATFWTDQFLPTGQDFTTSNAQTFFDLLEQKALIFATDNGNNDILFYCATNVPASQDYEFIPSNFYYFETGFRPQRRYMAKDESGNLRFSGTVGDVLHNLGYRHSADALPTRYNQDSNILPYPTPLQLYIQDGDSIDFDENQTAIYPLKVVESFDPSRRTIPWRIEISQEQMFGNETNRIAPGEPVRSSGGTKEPPRRTTRPTLNDEVYTGTFTGVLSEFDDNTQAALETLDQHTHSSSFQPLDSDLTAIAALSPANDDIIQRKAGAWVNRTLTQLITDLTELIQDLVGGMIGNLDGISVTYDDTDGEIDYALDDGYITDLITAAAIPLDGWIVPIGTWSYSSADAPTFVISVNTDITAYIKVGQRIKLTQTTTKYFIVTAVGSYSGGATLITVYGGTDYTLANAAISNPYYSPVKAPFGFPLDPDKWTVKVTDTSDRTQASPVQNTWYNLGSITISIPIGAWYVEWKAIMYTLRNGTAVNQFSTLSTANNSESDGEFTAEVLNQGATSTALGGLSTPTMRKVLSVASKTSYFLNARTNLASGTSIAHRGDIGTTIVKAVCAYL